MAFGQLALPRRSELDYAPSVVPSTRFETGLPDLIPYFRFPETAP